jgi:2-haloacid dehalogenase
VSSVRHIVFDLGQVLLRWDPEIPYRRLIPDAEERRLFLAEICSPEWNLEQDRGRSWEDAEALLVARHPERAALIRAFRQNHAEMIPGEIDETVAVFDRLVETGADLTALTNWAPDTFAEAEARFPLLKRFRGITVSGRVGMVKPDLAIYRHHERAFGLDRDAILFFDDNPANVRGARTAGWRAEQFTDAHALEAQLRAHGVPA